MYKTGHAFTYLLLKESAANNVINVSLFAYDEITLKTLNVNKRRQYIGKKISGNQKSTGWDDETISSQCQLRMRDDVTYIVTQKVTAPENVNKSIARERIIGFE